MKKYHGFVNRTATLKRRDETIKELKKENKNLSKAIKEIEQEKKEDIASLLHDKAILTTALYKEIDSLKDKVERLQKKKWYQFIPASSIEL